MCGGREQTTSLSPPKIDLNCLPNKTPIHQIDLTVSVRLHKSYLNANVFSERFVYYSIIGENKTIRNLCRTSFIKYWRKRHLNGQWCSVVIWAWSETVFNLISRSFTALFITTIFMASPSSCYIIEFPSFHYENQYLCYHLIRFPSSTNFSLCSR